MMQSMEDVLNQPRVLAWMLKGLVPEWHRLSIKDIMDIYVSKTHRYVSFRFPKPNSEKKCWVIDLDIPMNVNLEDLSPAEAVIYDKARCQLLRFNADFYAVCAEDMRRGYRIAIDFPENLDTSYEEDEVLGITTDGLDFAHFLTIHIGQMAKETDKSYVRLLTDVYRYISSAEVLENTFGIRM